MLKKLGWSFLFVCVAIAGLMTIYYRIDGIPTPETDRYLDSPDFTLSEERDRGLLLQPKIANGRGILIMHGAVIKPRSYAKTAAYFAERGYTVYLPYGFNRMSIAAIDKTARRISQSKLANWYAIGHSMGGMAGLSVVRQLPDRFRAVALWATAMPADFTDLSVPILFLWGDKDGLLGPGRYATAKSRLPAATEHMTLHGANHQDFALYSHQFFDGLGDLGPEKQIDQANHATAKFFAQFDEAVR